MLVKQISVFLENKSGRLAEVTKRLAEKNIDIRALSIADTTDFGILRLIVNKPEEAEEYLKENGFMVSAATVIAIVIEDRPGGLSVVLESLENQSIAIEYMYAFVGKSGKEALVILRVEDNLKALETLKNNNIKVVPSSKVYDI
ncbi:MAG: ACT domain-containing protein [Vulcanibacillus sp.]